MSCLIRNNRRRAYWSDTRGSATVELLVVIPFIFALIGFAAEFGRVLIFQHTMSQSVRSGAQYLSNVPLNALQSANGACQAGPLDRARGLVLSGFPRAGAASTYPWWTDASTINCAVTRADASAVSPDTEFWVVELRADLTVNLPLLAFLSDPLNADGSNTLRLSAAHRARVLSTPDPPETVGGS